jgi:glycosyltransferase involved in cell wall biosynthesis
MLVSIIIPTHNRSELLQEAIKSCYEQTYRPIECIVVDDGSTDNTKAVVEELTKNIDAMFTLHYIYQQNAGAQVARNTGTALTTGEFIQYLDSDDLLYPDKLKKQVDYLISNSDCDGVFGDWEMGTAEKNELITAYKIDDLIDQMLTKRCIANFSFLMRRSIVQKIGDWDVNIKRNQEIDFHLRGVLAGGNFAYQSLNCGLWRTHRNERINNKANLFEAIQFYQKWEKILLQKHLFTNSIKHGIANNYMWFLGEYPGNSYKELSALLKEIHRLNPLIPIFNSSKFSSLRKIIGFDMAAKMWIYRYKQMIPKDEAFQNSEKVVS